MARQVHSRQQLPAQARIPIPAQQQLPAQALIPVPAQQLPAQALIPVPEQACIPWTAETVASHVVKTGKNPLTFGFDDEAYRGLRLEPFYRIHFERYAVYWPVVRKE